MEFVFTPGRITIIGEADGNNLRRVYTDGRPHPAARDADPTFHGHSIGHWEGDTLVVDTDQVMPQSEIAPSEGVGIPNGAEKYLGRNCHCHLKSDARVFESGVERNL